MATLESKTTKLIGLVRGRQIISTVSGVELCPLTPCSNSECYGWGDLSIYNESTHSVGPWIETWSCSSLIGTKREMISQPFWYTGLTPYLLPKVSMAGYKVTTYTVEYDFTQLIDTLQAAYTSPDDLLLSIILPLGPEFDKIIMSYGLESTPNISILNSEGHLVTLSQNGQSQYDYLKRLLNDMYTNNMSSRSAFIHRDISYNSKEDTHNSFQNVPCSLGIWLYVISKTELEDIDITVKLKEGESVDDTTPNMEEEVGNETPDEETDTGLNEINIRDYSHTNEEGMQVIGLSEFDYIYIPESVDLTNIDSVVVSVGIVAGHVEGAGLTHTNVYVKEIVNSFKNADTMSFIEHVKYHEAGIFKIGDKVFGLIFGETRFLGWIKFKNRVITENEQYIEYQAVGAKEWLQTLPFSVQYKTKDKSIQWLFNDISSKIPRSIVNYVSGISLLPTSILPELRADAATFSYALDLIIDYARKYGYYINYDKTLSIYDLENLSIVDLNMPSEGEYLKEHPEYKIISKHLSVDVSDCRTRCILRGDYPIEEFDEVHSVIWENNIGIINLNKIIQPNLISNTSLPIYVYNKNGEIITPYNIIYVDCNTGLIKIIGDIQTNLHIRYCFKEPESLKYDTGWQGTAYNDYKIQQVLMQNDIRFKKIILPEGVVRDNTGLLSDYAKNLLDPLKNWKVGGTIILDGLNLDIMIGKAIRINNSGCAELEDTKLAVMQITWDFENHITQLSLTNDYYLGSSIIDPINDERYDERKLIEQVILLKGKQQDFPWVFDI